MTDSGDEALDAILSTIDNLPEHYLHAIAVKCVLALGKNIKVGPYNLTPTEIDYIKHGKLVMAIKEVRARTGYSLKDAKELVDFYRQDTGV